MIRAVDAKATKIARARHQRGVDHLNAIFAFDEASARDTRLEKLRSFSPVERARRRARGKLQRRARRGNRA